MRRIIMFVSLCAVILLQGACERRPLLLGTSVADLVLVVHDTLGVGKVQSGEMYEMRSYGQQDELYRSSSFISPSGGPVNLPEGDYKLLIHRFDNPTIVIEGGERHETIHAYTGNVSTNTKQLFNSLVREVMTKAPEDVVETTREVWEQLVDGDVAWEPDWFFVARLPKVEVPLRDSESLRFRVQADAMPEVFPCRLTVKGVTGKHRISGVTAFLTGVSRGVMLASGNSDLDPVTITFPLTVGDDSEPMTGNFRIFSFVPDALRQMGRTDSPEIRNILFLAITDTGGGNYLFTFDVTSQCENSKNGIDVVINVEVILNFEVPEPERGGGGFAPTVEDWDVHIYHIDL